MYIRTFAFLICGALLLTAGIAATKSYAYLAPDSFTYFTLAKQFWQQGMFMSFTGVDHTTGIHLGYYLLLLPFFPLFSMSIPAWSFIINGTLIGVSVYILSRALGVLPALVAGAIAISPYGMHLTNNGMESALLFFTLSLTTLFFYRNGEMQQLFNKPKYAYLFGLVLGTVVLARLDSVVLVAPVSLAAFTILFMHSRSLGRAISFSICITLPFLLIAFGIGAVYTYYDGSPLPVSGSIKSSFPVISSGWFSTLLTLKIFLLSLVSLLFVSIIRFMQIKRIDYYLAALLAGCVALTLYNAFFASGIGAWYGTAPFFAALVALGLLVKILENYIPKTAMMGLVLLITIVSVALHTMVSTDDWVTPHQYAAVVYETMIRKKGETAGELKDGVFAFYANSPVFSLTGLGNNTAYVEALESGSIRSYLTQHNIAFIAGGNTFSGVQVRGFESLFTHCKNPEFDNGYVRIYRTELCLKK